MVEKVQTIFACYIIFPIIFAIMLMALTGVRRYSLSIFLASLPTNIFSLPSSMPLMIMPAATSARVVLYFICDFF